MQHKHKKNIVVKKVDALNILKDNLSIRVYNSISNQTGTKIKVVHYKDVLKALIERRITETQSNTSDHRIKGKLKSKIGDLWIKKHKELTKYQNNRLYIE